MFITLVKLDPPLLLTAHTSPSLCNNIHTRKSIHTIGAPLFQKWWDVLASIFSTIYKRAIYISGPSV